MSAYMIIFAEISDRQKFLEGYSRAASALVEQYGGRYLLLGPGGMVLEGLDMESPSVAVSEWPDTDSALAFWNSDEYAEAKKLREGISRVEVVLMEGELISHG